MTECYDFIVTGDYLMKVYFGEKPLKRCPIVFCVMEEVDPNKIWPEKVVVVGPGLTNGFCNEEAEFIIDGSNAGPGKWSSMFIIRLRNSFNHLI